MGKRFVCVTFGSGGKVHIRDNESKAHNHSLCGYNGFFSAECCLVHSLQIKTSVRTKSYVKNAKIFMKKV